MTTAPTTTLSSDRRGRAAYTQQRWMRTTAMTSKPTIMALLMSCVRLRPVGGQRVPESYQ